MVPLHKTTVTVTVYSREPIPDARDIADILREMDDGEYIGGSKITDRNEIAYEDARAELIAIGNDGSFFDLWGED